MLTLGLPVVPADPSAVSRYLAAKTSFFVHSFSLIDLRQRQYNLYDWCIRELDIFGIAPNSYAGALPSCSADLGPSHPFIIPCLHLCRPPQLACLAVLAVSDTTA